MDASIKISDQPSAVYLLFLKNEGLLELAGYSCEPLSGRVWLEFSPKDKALDEIRKMENQQAKPIQPKRLLDSFIEFKNIIRKARNP